MADALAREVIRDWERRQGDRGTYLSHCQQVANYMLPDRADYTTEHSPGQKRMQWIFDSTPMRALEDMTAGLASRLTSATLPWFALEADADRINRLDRVRQWNYAAAADLYGLFNNPRTGFATQSHELYLDLCSVGTAVMAGLDHLDFGVAFSTRHLKECCIAENADERIDRLSRRWQWTAKQAVEKWGRAAGEQANKAYAEGEDQRKFWFHHRVRPRPVRDPQRADRRHKPFESLYVAEADQLVIDEGGFDEFPYMAPRFSKLSGEVNGRGPGIWELPDVKMLMELVKVVLKGAQKAIDPPLMLPDDGFIVPVRTTPGSLNYFRAGTRPTDRIAPIETKGDSRLGLDTIQALRQQIKEGFYNHLLQMPTDPRDPASAGKGVTATFTQRQLSENMQVLAPLLSRLAAEWLEPLITRVFAMRWRLSRMLNFGPGSPFPPPPEELRGQRLNVVYLSPLAMAQRASELSAVDQVVQRQLQLRNIDPQAPNVLDSEAIIRLEARDLNAPVEILKTPQRLQQEAAAAAEMQQQAHQAQMAEQVAGAANQGAQAVGSLAGLRRAA